MKLSISNINGHVPGMFCRSCRSGPRPWRRGRTPCRAGKPRCPGSSPPRTARQPQTDLRLKNTMVKKCNNICVLCKVLKKRRLMSKGSRKKNILLMAGPLRPTPPPSSLTAVETLERWKKRFQKKLFFLNGP